MMPLGMANVGDVNIIKQINGRDDVRQHLAELGFVARGGGFRRERTGRQSDPFRQGKPDRVG